MSATSADQILYVENDVLVRPPTISHLIAALQNGSDIAVGAILESDEATVHFMPARSQIIDLPGGGARLDLDRGRQSGANQRPDGPYAIDIFERHAFLMRSDTASSLGDLDELMFCRTDLDLSLACHSAGARISLIPQAQAVLDSGLELCDRDFYSFRWDLHRVRKANERLISKWGLVGYKRTINHAYDARQRLSNLERRD